MDNHGLSAQNTHSVNGASQHEMIPQLETERLVLRGYDLWTVTHKSGTAFTARAELRNCCTR